MIWASLTIIACQVVIMGMLAWFVRTFGAYTAATLKAHESNMLVYQQALKILEYTNAALQAEEKSA